MDHLSFKAILNITQRANNRWKNQALNNPLNKYFPTRTIRFSANISRRPHIKLIFTHKVLKSQNSKSYTQQYIILRNATATLRMCKMIFIDYQRCRHRDFEVKKSSIHKLMNIFTSKPIDSEWCMRYRKESRPGNCKDCRAEKRKCAARTRK